MTKRTVRKELAALSRHVALVTDPEGRIDSVFDNLIPRRMTALDELIWKAIDRGRFPYPPDPEFVWEFICDRNR